MKLLDRLVKMFCQWLWIVLLVAPQQITAQEQESRDIQDLNISGTIPRISGLQATNQTTGSDLDLIGGLIIDGEGFAAGQTNSGTAVFDIEVGDNPILVRVVVFSREWPTFTGSQSSFDDIVTFRVENSDVVFDESGTFRVNDLHQSFATGEFPGGNALVAEFELNLSEFPGSQMLLSGTATNVADGNLGSGVAIMLFKAPAQIRTLVSEPLRLCVGEFATLGSQVIQQGTANFVAGKSVTITASDPDKIFIQNPIIQSTENGTTVFDGSTANAVTSIIALEAGEVVLNFSLGSMSAEIPLTILEPSPVEVTLKSGSFKIPPKTANTINIWIKALLGNNLELPKIDAQSKLVDFEACCPGYIAEPDPKIVTNRKGVVSAKFEVVGAEGSIGVTRIIPPVLRKRLPPRARKVLQELTRQLDLKLQADLTFAINAIAVKNFCLGTNPPFNYQGIGSNGIIGSIQGSVVKGSPGGDFELSTGVTGSAAIAFDFPGGTTLILTGEFGKVEVEAVFKFFGLSVGGSDVLVKGITIDESFDLPGPE